MKMLPERKERLLGIKAKMVGTCPDCVGEGYIPIEGEPGKVSRCDCMIVFKYVIELVNAGIPQDYWSLTIDALHVDDGHKAMVKLFLENLQQAKDKGMGLVFLGPNGTGKTSMMCEIGKAALAARYKVRYFTLSQYVTTFQKDNLLLREYLESGDVLLIDELDKKYIKTGSEFVAKTVDDAFRSFLNNGKIIILCTNWDAESIGEVLGESTLSLLRRRCEFIKVVGDDYSPVLQGDYWERLKGEPDYWSESIVRNALRMERNFWEANNC